MNAALRRLLRNPEFSIGVVVSLALGICVNTTMFGVVDALLFRAPAHVREPNLVHRLYFKSTIPGAATPIFAQTSYPVYAALRQANRTVAGIVAYVPVELEVGDGAAIEDAHAVLVSPGYFALLGPMPQRGRFFTATDDSEPGSPPAAVVSDNYWRRRFGADPNVLGQSLRIGRNTFVIVGVAPRSFKGPDLAPVDIWLPLVAAAPDYFGRRWDTQRHNFLFRLVSRVRPGNTAAAAEAEMNGVYSNAARAAGESEGVTVIEMAPIQAGRIPGGSNNTRLALWLSVLSALVLAVACANVAGLMVARVNSLRHDLALRLALGASPGQLSSGFLHEALLLGAAGFAVATGIQFALLPAIARFLLLGDSAIGLEPGLRSLGYGALMSSVAGVVCALAPMSRARRADVIRVLVIGSHAGTGKTSRARVGVVLLQIALTFVLVVCAGLMTRSLRNIRSIRTGFDSDSVLAITADFRGSGFSLAAIDELFRTLRDRAARVPGIRQASIASAIPFLSGAGYTVWIPGQPEPPMLATGVPLFNAVTPEYFATLGTTITRGRAFTASDGPAPRPVVAIISETMARFIWPGLDPVGQCMKLGEPDAPCTTVVGVAQDARLLSLREDPRMLFYVPLGQIGRDARERALFVRVNGVAENLIEPVRAAMQEAAVPAAPRLKVRVLSTLTDPETLVWRQGSRLFAVFGLLALAIAAVGLYGLLAHGVAQRRREMGIRLALGGRPAGVVGMVFREAMLLTSLAVGVGAVLAIWVGRAISSLLYNVSAADPLIFVLAAGIFFVVATGASLLPSIAAARFHPSEILRDS